MYLTKPEYATHFQNIILLQLTDTYQIDTQAAQLRLIRLLCKTMERAELMFSREFFIVPNIRKHHINRFAQQEEITILKMIRNGEVNHSMYAPIIERFALLEKIDDLEFLASRLNHFDTRNVYGVVNNAGKKNMLRRYKAQYIY